MAASAAARNPDREDQRQRPKGTDPGIAHDIELALALEAAGEPVGRIAQAVLMERAGEQRGRADREQAAGERRQPEPGAHQVSGRAGNPDKGAGDWVGPGGARQIQLNGVRVMGHRQARQHAEGGLHVDPPGGKIA